MNESSATTLFRTTFRKDVLFHFEVLGLLGIVDGMLPVLYVSESHELIKVASLQELQVSFK